ncbi:MAG: UDP-N-acetylmuramoyl-tripeptide--D-alanyl-D-alanine ligase [Candidatus Marinimicrobia bacterium]|nr:UDP-N-acetylmuramoyl-tripeptide--D-alanyl-D-alanine ligase [Candidatus Neomarinimicrobiota bacterium]
MITWDDIQALKPLRTQNLPKEESIRGADIDSRRMDEGMIFIARRGEERDGHEYIRPALQSGAVAAIIEQRWFQDAEDINDLPLIVVTDADQALRELAKQVRSRFTGPVLGITGSNGKTTTKEMVDEVLSAKYNVLSTPGNFNNLWGLPLAILRTKPEHDFWVLEHGMNTTGEIAALCDISRPTCGLITTIAESHTKFFNSLDEIAAEKLSLFNAVPSNGVIFKNRDNPYTANYYSENKIAITYGTESKANYTGQIASVDAYSRVQCHIDKIGKVKLRVPGMFQLINALAAATVGLTFGIPAPQVKEQLENFSGVPGRVNILEKRQCTVIDDTYNANPSSMREAVDILAKMPTGNRRIAILGDMLELNSTTEQHHYEIGEYLANHRIDVVVGVGSHSEHIIEGVREHSDARTFHFPDYAACMDRLGDIVNAGDIVLVKGSHGIHLENVVEAL